jgi:hypothetical protein
MNCEAGSPCAVWFSGGKDSMLAIDRAGRLGYTDLRLVTLYDADCWPVRELDPRRKHAAFRGHKLKAGNGVRM